jgi:hypothetical protein
VICFTDHACETVSGCSPSTPNSVISSQVKDDSLSRVKMKSLKTTFYFKDIQKRRVLYRKLKQGARWIELIQPFGVFVFFFTLPVCTNYPKKNSDPYFAAGNHIFRGLIRVKTHSYRVRVDSYRTHTEFKANAFETALFSNILVIK